LPIAAALADRTVENTEYIAITAVLANADGGAGEVDLSFRVTVE
jgi:hypothetical protein